MTKRRKVLAAMGGLPLLAGCMRECNVEKGERYQLDDGHVEILDVGDAWADVKVDSDPFSGEYHLRKLTSNDRYERYELDSEFPAKIRFDCAEEKAEIYI